MVVIRALTGAMSAFALIAVSLVTVFALTELV